MPLKTLHLSDKAKLKKIRNKLSLSESCVKHNTKVKIYPDGSTSITYCKKAIFQDKGVEKRPQEPKNNDIYAEIKLKTETDKAPRDRTDELIRLHRERVRDIVLMNDFTHFFTITINPEEIDSFDVQAVKRKLHKWLNNQQQRKGLQYILIPEYHKSGRIHAHALVNDVFNLVDSGIRYNGKIVYNVPEWRYGWTTAIPVDENKLKLAYYVTKYITKGSEKIFGKYFWSSKNIQREPRTILLDTPYEDIKEKEYQPLKYDNDLCFKYSTSAAYDMQGRNVYENEVIYTNPDGTEEVITVEEACNRIWYENKA